MRKRFSIKDVSSSRLSIQRQEVEALVQQVWYLKDRCSSTVTNRITLCFFHGRTSCSTRTSSSRGISTFNF